jgi:hypothetical protein
MTAFAERPAPARVAIVAMGASNAVYNSVIASAGHRKVLFDETWVINAMATVLHHERAFVMQDVASHIRQEAETRNVAKGILSWLPEHPGPVYTTTAYPEWPCLVEYPTEAVLNSLGGPPYLNNSVAYAIAYAMYVGVKEMFLFGADFTYADNHAAESGRGCCEFLLGMCVARGIKVAIPQGSTMLDAHIPEERKLYGYAAPLDIQFENGRVKIARKAVSSNPTDPGPRIGSGETPIVPRTSSVSPELPCSSDTTSLHSPPALLPPLRLAQ